MEKSCGKGLSGFALKYIAMVSMLCGHANFLVIRRGSAGAKGVRNF